MSPAASLDALLAELPSRVRAAVDTSVFARLGMAEQEALERLAEITASHVVAYDLRVAEEGFQLCAAVGRAHLDRDQIAVLQVVEQQLPRWIALVGYARPVELCLPENEVSSL